jgi:hypothetical protein
MRGVANSEHPLVCHPGLPRSGKTGTRNHLHRRGGLKAKLYLGGPGLWVPDWRWRAIRDDKREGFEDRH